MDQKFDIYCDGEAREELAVLYERLLANLDRELSVQQALLQLLDEERAALTVASTGAIEQTNARKEGLLLKEKENASARLAIIDRVCSLLGWDGKKVTLSALVDSASDEATAAQLRGSQQALTKLMDKIRSKNNRNRELIRAALEDIQGSLQLIQSMVSPGANYQKTGRFSTNTMQGSFIHREG